MKLVLAPMEGLTDAPMRALLTSVGGYDWCVSEFVRVTGTLLPERVFRRWVPEAEQGFRTPSGTPVHVQLLGSDPVAVAENAARVAGMGAPAIDLNFGCPAKTVNRHRGGAVLLDEPETVHAIVAAVRRAVPAQVPVSAKMRLGYHDREKLLDNARGIVDAGASWLTVHARTKDDGYKPPAYWDEISRLREVTGTLQVIANGEIWREEHALRCREQSGCDDLMLGRGAVTSPDLARRIRAREAGIALPPMPWRQLCTLQRHFLATLESSDTVACGRYKQWLGMMTRERPEAMPLWAVARRLRTRPELDAAIAASAFAAGEIRTAIATTVAAR